MIGIKNKARGEVVTTGFLCVYFARFRVFASLRFCVKFKPLCLPFSYQNGTFA